MHHLTTPLSEDDITKLKVCDEISLSGIYIVDAMQFCLK